MSEQEPRNFLRRILPELKKLAKTLFPFSGRPCRFFSARLP